MSEKAFLKEMGKKRQFEPKKEAPGTSSENFGKYVFSRSVMQKMLPKDIYKNIVKAMEGQEKIKQEYADTIAVAMKEWAMSHGATHYSHWFQPLTGASAEKHDSFIDWNTPDGVIEKFNGKQLIQGEPDASSFPSGGLRSTYEARGYTGWDPTSPVFLWKGGDGITLCIPSVFFSWTGDVLDSKIPLLRSDARINQAVLRLLKSHRISLPLMSIRLWVGAGIFCYRPLFAQFAARSCFVGQNRLWAPLLQKDRSCKITILDLSKIAFWPLCTTFETAALELGIPVKTRHNEVAPAQHEVAPVLKKLRQPLIIIFLLMELMRQIASSIRIGLSFT